MWAGVVLLLGLQLVCHASVAPSHAPSVPPTVSPARESALEAQYLAGGLIVLALCCCCLCAGMCCCKDRRKPAPITPLSPADIELPGSHPDNARVLYDDRFGLGCSGGGIRSAAFCSGVLWGLINFEPTAEELADRETEDIFNGGRNVSLPSGKIPQYISCVSGGGYVGSSFTYWTRVMRGQDPRIWGDLYFEKMRKGIGYYCDCTSILTGLYDTVTVLAMLGILGGLSVVAFFPTTYVLGEFILLPYSAYYNAFTNTTSSPDTTQEFAIRTGINDWNNDMLWLLWLFICCGGPLYLGVSWVAHKKANEELQNTFVGDAKTKRWLRGWKMFAEIMSHLNYAILSVFVILIMVVLFDFSSDEGITGQLNSALTTTAVIWSLRLIIMYLLFTKSIGLVPLFVQSQILIWIYYTPHRALMIPHDSNFDYHYQLFATVSKILLPFLGVLGLVRERMVFEFSRWRLSRCFFNVPGITNFELSYVQRAKKLSRMIWTPPKFGQYPTYISCATANGWMVIPAEESLFDPLELQKEQEFNFYYDLLNTKDKAKVDKVLSRAVTFSPVVRSRSLARGKVFKTLQNHVKADNAAVLDESIVLARNIVMKDRSLIKRIEQFELSKADRSRALAENLRELAWSQAKSRSSGYDILAMSTEGWWERYEDGMTAPLKIFPTGSQNSSMDGDAIVGANPDLLLSEAMCMSAAAGSFSNGEFGGLEKDEERTQVMFGLHMGRWVETSVKRGASGLLFLVLVDLAISLPVIIAGGTDDPFKRTHMDYDTGTNDGNYGAYMGGTISLLLFVVWCACLPIFSFFFPKIYPFLPRARDFLTLTGEVCWSHSIPSMLYVSDGGHTENLGLCPLLARRLEYIVLACGAEDETCEALLSALEQGRKKLGCWFRPVRADQQRRRVDRVTSDPELDLLSDIAFFARDDARVLVIEVIYREQMRSWRNHATRAFVPNAKPLNEKGYIFYVKPISVHPRGFQDSSETMLRDEPFGAKCIERIPSSHGNLAGCCCSACHRFGCLGKISGKFPFHHTAFQFFTPMLFDAYHAQGVQAMKDAFAITLRANRAQNIAFDHSEPLPNLPELAQIPVTLEGVKKEDRE